MKDKFYRFMQGRYGVDQFAKFTMGVALVSIVLAIFVNTGSSAGSLLDMLGLVAIVYTYFRIFSRNISKRAQENQKYLSATAKLRQRLNKEKNMMKREKGLPYLYLSFLRTESQDSKRKRKDRDQLSKVS